MGLTTKLKQCVGVELLALGDKVTGLKLCPGQKTTLWQGSNYIIQEKYEKSVLEPDTTLCINIKKFETNIDKNKLSKDSAYGKACLYSKCVQTDPVTFGGWSNEVNFDSGPKCIP